MERQILASNLRGNTVRGISKEQNGEHVGSVYFVLEWDKGKENLSTLVDHIWRHSSDNGPMLLRISLRWVFTLLLAIDQLLDLEQGCSQTPTCHQVLCTYYLGQADKVFANGVKIQSITLHSLMHLGIS